MEGAPREPADPAPGPDAAAERAELARDVERALEALDGQERAMLVLRDLDELSYEDISGVLGIPLGTVKSRLHRARAALARMLEERHGA